MSTTTATTITELYDQVGYYNGSARVAGTNDGGIVDASGLTGTHDRGASNNILMPANGTRIVGPGSGSLTVQGRLGIVGSGGSTLEAEVSGITFDGKGYGSISGVTTRKTTTNSIHAATTTLSDVSFIDSGTPAGNLLTISVDDADDPIAVLLANVTVNGADEDCISTAADTNLTTPSTLVTINCTALNPGTDSNDQAMTGHNGFAIYDYNPDYTGNAAGADIAVATVDGTTHHIIGGSLTGKVLRAVCLLGVDIDCNGNASAVFTPNAAGVDATYLHNHFRNFGTLASESCIDIYLASGQTLTLGYNLVTNVGGNWTGNETANNCNLVAYNNASPHDSTGPNRILDVADLSGGDITCTITDNAFRCQTHAVRQDAGDTDFADARFTGNIFEQQGHSSYTIPTDTNTIAAPSEAQVTATGAGIINYPQPSVTAAVEAMRNGAATKINASSSWEEVLAAISAYLNPAELRPGLVTDTDTLKPSLVNSNYSTGAGDSTTIRRGLLTSAGNLKPGLKDQAGNLKPSLLK